MTKKIILKSILIQNKTLTQYNYEHTNIFNVNSIISDISFNHKKNSCYILLEHGNEIIFKINLCQIQKSCKQHNSANLHTTQLVLKRPIISTKILEKNSSSCSVPKLNHFSIRMIKFHSLEIKKIISHKRIYYGKYKNLKFYSGLWSYDSQWGAQ